MNTAMSLRLRLAQLALFVAAVLLSPLTAAQPEPAAAEAAKIEADGSLEQLTGRNLSQIDVVFEPPLWGEPTLLSSVRVGQTFTPEVARRALSELGDTGRFGELQAEVEPLGEGVRLRLRVVARRVLTAVRVSGSNEAEELLRSAGIQPGAEVTARSLPQIGDRLTKELGRMGYPEARVRMNSTDTDDPMQILLGVDVTLGEPLRVTKRHFAAWPDPNAPGLGRLLGEYEISEGRRADLEAIENADRQLEERLRGAGYHNARIEHSLTRVAGGSELSIRVYAGSRVVPRIEGNRRFDQKQLLEALSLDESTDRAPSALALRLREFYIARGFLDATVTPELRGKQDAPLRELVLTVREGRPVRVVSREFPCLNGDRDADDINSEIDSFLAELPGGDLLDAVDSADVDQLFGPKRSGSRATPLHLNPYGVYSTDVYDLAVEHLRDLFRSEGYLSAAVGPVDVERRRCDRRSPAGQCIPVGPRRKAPAACRYDGFGLPQPNPEPDPARMCREDLLHSVHCESELMLSIPIQIGPRTFVQSIAVDGNVSIPDEELLQVSELRLGAPLSQAEIDRARRRLMDRYAEEGFAFVDVEASPELSPDHKRANVRFLISERRQVRVSRIVVRGARLTSESLIRRRIALEVGDLYRRSSIRKTEERLATLGVFSGVTVGLEDPYVPASEKVVIVTVQERTPQVIDTRFGLSSGEGFRLGFEYRYLNLAGQAVQLTLRMQANYLPPFLIFEDDVRDKYRELDSIEDRIERRNTLTLELPEIGLGPLFRLNVQGVDVRDIARDFSLTKDAGILTLLFIPERRLSFQLGGSLERNNANIFGESPVQFRVPEGLTLVVAQRVAATWDRRDNPLGATKGTFVAADLEHANARPLKSNSDDTGAPMTPQSEFLRFSARVAGYVRLSERGLSLAASLRVGANVQLPSECERLADARRSCTYPDRLFFMGGTESMRGFLQDAMVPEDVAQDVLNGKLSIDKVVIRGGDLMVNPRLELRIPLDDSFQTTLFVDSGNLWTRTPSLRDFFRLRYAVGTGVRLATPVGPLAFDYGINAERFLDLVLRNRTRQRTWEDLGAFHFSVGLF